MDNDTAPNARLNTTAPVDSFSEPGCAEAARKIALLCLVRSGMSVPDECVQIRQSTGAPHTIEIDMADAAIPAGSLTDRLGTGAKIAALIHQTLRPAGQIGMVRIRFH